MRFAESIFLALLPAAGLGKAFVPSSTSQTDFLAANALRNAVRRASSAACSGHGAHSLPLSDLPHNGQNPHPPATYGSTGQKKCTLETARVRGEWDTLSPKEKRAYIDAVLCMLEKPSISGDAVPGARSRFDDFLGTHINQTLAIHGTGNFLSWHRYFTWTYEEALRNECGYKGDFPYLDWPRYAYDLLNAPIFDGSDISLGGNGAYVPHGVINIPNDATPNIVLPPGQGGGCVDSGPFKNMTVRLGPVVPVANYFPKNPREDGLGYNPRCLRRDMNTYAAERWATDQNVTDLILQSPNITAFQDTMQGDFPKGFLGVHTAGHFFVGSDPGGDIFSSPGDIYFYLQHAQIDRLWWIWQHQCPGEDRIEVVGGNLQFGNLSSPLTTLDDILDLGVNARPIKIRDAVDTMAGPFCYVYK